MPMMVAGWLMLGRLALSGWSFGSPLKVPIEKPPAILKVESRCADSEAVGTSRVLQ